MPNHVVNEVIFHATRKASTSIYYYLRRLIVGLGRWECCTRRHSRQTTWTGTARTGARNGTPTRGGHTRWTVTL